MSTTSFERRATGERTARTAPDDRPVWVDDVLAAAKPSAFTLLALALCILVGMSEGYDIQVMALAAPLVAKAWSLSSAAVGLLLTASVVGLVVGSLLLSPLGDLWGRRPGVIVGMLVAGVATVAGAWMPDMATLMSVRFVAGIGLGLALPNVIALAMEVVPTRWRVIAIVLVNCGYPLGGALGSAWVGSRIPTHGYPIAFLAGGIATLVVTLLCIALLPESPLLLARRPARAGELARLLQRLGGTFTPGPGGFALHEAAPPHSRVAALFERDRVGATLLLWLVNFAGLAMVYFFVNWLPSIIVGSGEQPARALMAVSLFSFSGIAGGVLLAMMLRVAPATRLLGVAYAVALVASLALAATPTIGTAFFALVGVAGAAMVGSQFCLTAVVNQFYPSAIRATASGYATGAGRLGAMFAPLAGAAVMASVVHAQQALAAAAAPAAVALLAVLVLERRTSLNRSVEPGATAGMNPEVVR